MVFERNANSYHIVDLEATGLTENTTGERTPWIAQASLMNADDWEDKGSPGFFLQNSEEG